ncbi:cytochrome P450 (plasmid) [Nocardiopsis flavescens]|uniref:LooP1 n=1 Tax=Nocardiopsis flavescens TaxID=758803 RepID=A0A6M5K9B7_9ACTN|nr:LooP1 [Nocardiopsis flavescens]QKW32435.1 cytochrome P450 [Nocardiopsis flavescens]
MSPHDLLRARPDLSDGGHAFFTWSQRMRTEHPVVRDPATGAWHLFRYEDTKRILSDPGVFSADLERVMPIGAFTRGNIATMDPPQHLQMRKLVSQAFTARTVQTLGDRIRAVSDELITNVEHKDEFDLVSEVTYQLPVIIISELLGVPSSDRQLFRSWVDDMLDPPYDQLTDLLRDDVVMNARRSLDTYLHDQVAARRNEPKEDMVTRLAFAEVDGARLSNEEIVGFTSFLLLAGSLTTTVLLGNTMRSLAENPHVEQEVRQNPSLIPQLLEEVLRYRPSFLPARRVTVTDVTISGVDIPANSFLTSSIMSANHDERTFENPDRFDIHRDTNPHLAFGHGSHFCLGAPLARLESRTLLEMLFTRMGHLEIATDAPIPIYGNPDVFGPKKLIVTKRN